MHHGMKMIRTVTKGMIKAAAPQTTGSAIHKPMTNVESLTAEETAREKESKEMIIQTKLIVAETLQVQCNAYRNFYYEFIHLVYGNVLTSIRNRLV
jgi:hypothetical protein